MDLERHNAVTSFIALLGPKISYRDLSKRFGDAVAKNVSRTVKKTTNFSMDKFSSYYIAVDEFPTDVIGEIIKIVQRWG